MKLNIKGIGHYLPYSTVSNDDLSKIMDTSDEWIYKRTGIKERRFSSLSTKDLALNAAKAAIMDANINPSDIGLVICATISADSFTPSLACTLLNDLGIADAMAFDVNAACSGFIYGLNVATSLLNTSNYKYALVIGAEVLSKLLDYNDRSTSILFGDGAGAVIVEATGSDSSFICHAKTDIDRVLYADGIKQNDIFKNSECTDYYLRMNGQEVYKFAISSCEQIIEEILTKNNLTVNDISYIIPHQANIRIIQSFAKKLDIDMDKIFVNLDKYGNTCAASVPIALSEAKSQGKIKKGDKLLLVGFGAGLTWAASIIEY